MSLRVSVNQLAALGRAIPSPRWYVDERLWTFLIASLIAENPERQIPVFCGEPLRLPVGGRVACEAEPISTRLRENNTVLDIAFGHIMVRSTPSAASTPAKETLAGITYSPHSEDAWVCFVEAKYLSDCDCKVTNDPLRNQLTRVIENLLCFQDANGQLPSRLFFALLTPRLFRDHPKARFYGYKMADLADRQGILAEIGTCTLTRRATGGYCYPDLAQRLEALAQPRWVTFEEVLQQAGLGDDLDVLRRPDQLAHIHGEIRDRLAAAGLRSGAGAQQVQA
jgi:hypothetical protein